MISHMELFYTSASTMATNKMTDNKCFPSLKLSNLKMKAKYS